MTAIRRPVLRYHGGKWRLAQWILGFFPMHRTYVEPFGGAASVLIQKPLAYGEVYNDLDAEVVNVFRVLRDPRRAARLAELLTLTPYGRAEFISAYRRSKNPIEQARRTIIKAYMGYGSTAIHDPGPSGMRTASSKWRPPTGFRADSDMSGTTPAVDWSHYPEYVAGFCRRLRGVVIERRSAIAVIEQHDSPETLHYVDPPYLHRSRADSTGRTPSCRGARWHRYRHEMSDRAHQKLADVLQGVRGMVVLSGYPAEWYEELYRGWERHQVGHLAAGGRQRTEVVWLNPACAAALARERSQLHLGLESWPTIAKSIAKEGKMLVSSSRGGT